jgi:hypothetical protein
MSAGSSTSGPGARPTPQSMGLFGARQNFIWSHDALKTLYHFIRCSQLEYVGQEGRAPIQVTLSQSKNNFKLNSKSIRLTHFLCDYFVNNVLFLPKPLKDLLVILFFGQLVELPFYCYKLLRQ